MLATAWGWLACWPALICAGFVRDRRGVLCLALGLIGGFLVRPDLSPTGDFETRPISWSVRVLSSPGPDFALVEHEGRTFRLLMEEDWPPLVPASIVQVNGVLKPPTELQSRTSTLSGRIQADVPPRVVSSPFGVMVWANSLSRSFAAWSARSLHPEIQAVISGIVFNQTSEIDSDDYRALQRSGLLHLVSASGMHVFLFTAMLGVLLRFLPVPRAVQAALLVLLLLLYALSAGLGAPIVRAVIMASVWILAPFVRRISDPVNTLAVAALIQLVLRPSALFEAGFQLSFVAMAALIFLAPSLTDSEFDAWRSLRETITSGVAVWVFSLPLVAYLFGQVSLTAILSNLFVTPILIVLMATSLFAWGCDASGIPVLVNLAGTLSDLIVSPLGGYVIGIARGLGEPTWAVVQIPRFSPVWVPILMGSLLLFWQPYRSFEDE